MKVGIEIGGTFTDLLSVDDSGAIRIEKVLSTPEDLTDGALEGLTRLLRQAECEAQSITQLLHGSTVATNALIERKGAAVGLISTAGFEDVILIGRQERDDAHDMFYQRPPGLVRRREIRGVPERLAVDGSVITPLDVDAAERAIAELVEEQQITSLAVCLLHAYHNPVHEQAIARIAAERYPQLEVSLSSQLAPEHREYERTSTTVLSAYVRPVVRQYLARLQERLSERGFNGTALIMQSNGGVLPSHTIADQPARMYLSGPAAGVTGAAFLARRSGAKDLITMDVGGTSCDVSLVTNGEPQMTTRAVREFRVHGQPINLVMMDIFALGAGGGSIAWVDVGGMLQVGPQSAGAAPGPACYAHGGEDFTLTDALLMLGLIEPNRFADGQVRLDANAPQRVATPLAEHFQLDAIGLARSVHQIAVANVAQALRFNTVQRGRDPRDYALCPYGGAGPLLAAHVAEELSITRIVVPPAPGVFSAFGLCVADMRMDFVRALPGVRVCKDALSMIENEYTELRREAESAFAGIDDRSGDLRFSHLADARYAGQGYELRITVDLAALSRLGAEHITTRFNAGHIKQYGHDFPEPAVELVNLRIVAERGQAGEVKVGSDDRAALEVKSRTVLLRDGELEWPVFDRRGLAKDWCQAGPALIVEGTTSTVVPNGWTAGIGPYGILDINR